MAIEDKIRCGECGQPLSSWAEHHTVEDCAWWKQTQAARDALVGLAALQQKGEHAVRARSGVFPYPRGQRCLGRC